MSKAYFFISAAIFSLLILDIFFESLIPSGIVSKFIITAAATTGPAKQPLPTSSMPQI